MAVKVGSIIEYDTGYRVMSGTRGTDTFFEEIFPYNKYGGARKAKRAALKLWNSDAFQNRAKEMSPEGKSAKAVGLTFDEYVKLPENKRRSLVQKEKGLKKFKLRQETGTQDLKFKVNKKPYSITRSRGGLPPSIPLLKQFIKSFDKWKAGDKTLRSYYNMTDKLSEKTKIWWRQLARFAQGKVPVIAKDSDPKVYQQFFEDLKIPQEELDTLKTFTHENYQKLFAEKMAPKAWATESFNPLIKPVLEFLKKNPDATKAEFLKGIRAATGKRYGEETLMDAAVTTHRGSIDKIMRTGRGEKITETQLKAYKGYDAPILQAIVKSLYHIDPHRMHRDFGLTITDVLKDQPKLQAEALNRYKRFKQLERYIKDKIGFMGKKALVEMDHPISFKILKKTGNLAKSLRVNPIARDINQWKRSLDRQLNMYQDRLANPTKRTPENIKGLRALNELNQTLFGKGSPYFTVSKEGVSQIKGLPKEIYEGDLLKRFRGQLGLHETLKENIKNVPDDVWASTQLNKEKITANLAKLGKGWNPDIFEAHLTEWTKANPKWTKILEGRAGCLSSGGRVGLAAGTGPSECLKNKIRNEPGLIMKAFRSLPKSGRIGAVIAGLGAVGAGAYAMFGGSEAVADEPTMKFNATEGRFVDNEGDPETQEGVLNWIGEHPVYSGLAPIPVGMGAGLGADMMKAPKIANFFKSMKFMLPPAYAAEKLYQYKEGEDLGEMFTNPLDAVWAMALDTKASRAVKWSYYTGKAAERAGKAIGPVTKAAAEAEQLGFKPSSWKNIGKATMAPASRGTRLVFPFGTEKYGFGKAKKLAARGLPRALGIGARMLPLGPLPVALLAGSMAWDKYKFNQKVGDHIDALRVRGVVSEEDADTMDTIYKQGWLGTTALGAKLLGSEELMFEGETRDLDWQKGVLDEMKRFYEGREEKATDLRAGERQEDFFSWFNRGGRVGLAEGGPPRGVSRRTFLKWLVGSIAAGVAALSGKGAKQAVKTATTTAAKTPQKFMNVEGMPSWFPRAVEKIKTHGKLIDMADKDYVNGDIYQMMIPVKTPKYDTVAGKRTLSGYENTREKVLLEENPLSGEIEISWNVADMDGEMIRSIRFQPGKSGYQKFGADPEHPQAWEYERVKVDSPEFTYGSPDQSDPLRKEFEFMDISTQGDEVVDGLEKMTGQKNMVMKDGTVMDVTDYSKTDKEVDEAFQKKIYKDLQGEEALIPEPEGYVGPDGDWVGDSPNEIIEGIIPDHLKKAEGGIIARRPGAVAPLSGPEGIMSLSFNPKRVNVVGS